MANYNVLRYTYSIVNCKISYFLFTGYIKYVSLVVLTVQNAALGLSMRYARTRENVEMFSSAAGE